MISIQSLQKSYKGVTVLNIEQLFIGQNESFGLVGNNGAGKTTLFRTILDLIRPTAGKVEINGKNVQANDEWKSYLGSFLDEGFLIPYLTPDEYFRFVGKLHNYSDADMKSFYEKFEELFNDEIIGKDKYISDLSKGNLKKVGIAAAFMGFIVWTQGLSSSIALANTDSSSPINVIHKLTGITVPLSQTIFQPYSWLSAIAVLALLALAVERGHLSLDDAWAAAHPEVLALHATTGSHCALLRVAVVSPEHLQTLLFSLGEIGKTSTSVVLTSQLEDRLRLTAEQLRATWAERDPS